MRHNLNEKTRPLARLGLSNEPQTKLAGTMKTHSPNFVVTSCAHPVSPSANVGLGSYTDSPAALWVPAGAWRRDFANESVRPSCGVWNGMVPRNA